MNPTTESATERFEAIGRMVSFLWSDADFALDDLERFRVDAGGQPRSRRQRRPATRRADYTARARAIGEIAVLVAAMPTDAAMAFACRVERHLDARDEAHEQRIADLLTRHHGDVEAASRELNADLRRPAPAGFRGTGHGWPSWRAPVAAVE